MDSSKQLSAPNYLFVWRHGAVRGHGPWQWWTLCAGCTNCICFFDKESVLSPQHISRCIFFLLNMSIKTNVTQALAPLLLPASYLSKNTWFFTNSVNYLFGRIKEKKKIQSIYAHKVIEMYTVRRQSDVRRTHTCILSKKLLQRPPRKKNLRRPPAGDAYRWSLSLLWLVAGRLT